MAAQVPSYGAQKEVLRPISTTPHTFYDPRSDMADVPAVSRRASARFTAAVDKLTDQMDQARVLDVETHMRQYVVDQTYGENGYTRLKGQAALDPDDQGRGLAERSINGFDEELSRLSEEQQLTPRQQALARKQVAAIRGSYYNNVSQYAVTEARNYQVSSIKGALMQNTNAAAGYFTNPRQLAEGMAYQDLLIDRAADLQGWSPEEREMQKLQASTDYFESSINAALSVAERDPHAAQFALSILNNNRARITGAMAQELRAKCDTYMDRLQEERVSELYRTSNLGLQTGYSNALAAGVGGTSALNLQRKAAGMYETARGDRQIDDDGIVRNDTRGLGNTGFGVSMMTPENAKRTAERHGIVWDAQRFADKADYNNVLGMAYMDDCLQAAAGDTTVAYAMYFTSEETVRKAMDAANKEGNPGAWFAKLGGAVQLRVEKAKTTFDKSMAGRVIGADGKDVSPFDPAYAAASRQWKTRADAEKFVLSVDSRAAVNPEWKEKLVNRLMLDTNRDKADYTQEQQNRIAQAKDYLQKSGGNFSAIPTGLLSSFNYTEQKALRDLAVKISIGDRAPDYKILARYQAHPEELAAMSDAAFGNLAAWAFGDQAVEMAKLRAKTQQELTDANETIGKNRKAEAEGRVDFGLAPSRASIVAAVKALDKDFDIEKGNNNDRVTAFGMVLARMAQTNPAVAKALKSDTGRVYILQRLWQQEMYPEGPSMGTVSLDDLPDRANTDARRVLTQLVRQSLPPEAQGREPTKGELTQGLIQLMNLKNADFGLNTSDPSTLPALDEDLYNYVCDELGVKRGTRNNAVYRQYIIERIKGTELACILQVLTQRIESGGRWLPEVIFGGWGTDK